MIDFKKMRISKMFLPKLILTTSPIGVLVGSDRVAEIGNPFMLDEDVESAASLFLAAPNLLAACEAAFEECYENVELSSPRKFTIVKQQLKDAIDSAKGRV